MTTKVNERESTGSSRTSKRKSVNVTKQVATGGLVIFLIVMLLVPLIV